MERTHRADAEGRPTTTHDDGDRETPGYHQDNQEAAAREKGETPVQHGSVGPTQDHEQAKDLIMGESDTDKKR